MLIFYHWQIFKKKIRSLSLICKILIESESREYAPYSTQRRRKRDDCEVHRLKGKRRREPVSSDISSRSRLDEPPPASPQKRPKRRRAVKRAQGRWRTRTRTLPPVFVHVAELILRSLPRSRLEGLLSETRSPPLA